MTAGESLKVALTTAACVFFLSCSEDSHIITPPPIPQPAPTPQPAPPPFVNRFKIEGNAMLTDIGHTTQLKATLVSADGTSADDVTDRTVWTSDLPGVIAVSPSGLVSAGSLGVVSISARFGNWAGSLRVTATPPGTLVVEGTVREPGQGGGGRGLRPADVRVFEPRSGASMTTDGSGGFTLGGLTSLRVRFERGDLEPREVDLSPSFNDVAMQRVVRISAGQTATPVPLAPGDLKYTMNAGEECFPCRMIRIDLPASGTLQLLLKWTTGSTRLGLWVNGVLYEPAGGSEVSASVSASAGQSIVFVEGFGMDYGGHVNFSLETSYSP